MSRPRKPLNCDFCSGKANCFIRHELTDESLGRVIPRRMTREVAKGEIIYRAGDKIMGIWIICNGKIKTFKQSDQRKNLITSIARSGDLFGHADFLATSVHSESAVALSGSLVTLIDRKLAHSLIEEDRNFSLRLLKVLAEKVNAAEKKATNLAYQQAKERLVAALDELGDDSDPESDEMVHPTVRVRRQELAELAGMTVETTVRTLKDMEKRGEVRIEGRLIHRLNRLREPLTVAA